MLYSTIGDMENLIEDLKLKVSKAKNQADSAEHRCIRLSETNAELSEELGFLRGRLGCLEASLNQAEEMKLATARDIDIRTKLVANLLMQLGMERETLQPTQQSTWQSMSPPMHMHMEPFFYTPPMPCRVHFDCQKEFDFFLDIYLELKMRETAAIVKGGTRELLKERAAESK